MITGENFTQTARDFGGKNARVKDFGPGPGIRARAYFDDPRDARAFAELCRESHHVRNAKPHKNRTLVSFWGFLFHR